jgi:hypothetical protein
VSLLRVAALALAQLGVVVVLAVAGGLAGQAIGAAAARRASRDRVRCARRPRQVMDGWTQPQVDREVRDMFEREGLR